MDNFTYISDAVLAQCILAIEVETLTPGQIFENNRGDLHKAYTFSVKSFENFVKEHPNYFEEDHRLRQLQRFVELHPEVGEQRCRPDFVERFVNGEFVQKDSKGGQPL